MSDAENIIEVDVPRTSQEQTKARTNADVIRGMNNQQLAAWIMGVVTLHDYQSLLEWLNKEVPYGGCGCRG